MHPSSVLSRLLKISDSLPAEKLDQGACEAPFLCGSASPLCNRSDKFVCFCKIRPVWRPVLSLLSILVNM